MNLLQYQDHLRVKTDEEKRFLWDAYRKKWVALTPEELVRQLCLVYLTDELGINKNRISTETAVVVNQLRQRADIIVFDAEAKPLIIVECKAATIALNDDVLYQALRYNLTLQVPFCIVTNGLELHHYELDYDKNEWRKVDFLNL